MTEFSFEITTESRKYPVYVGQNLIERLGEIIGESTERAFVICDNIISDLFLETLIEGLRTSDIQTESRVIQSGESLKSLDSVKVLYEFLSENFAARSDTVIALGGGIVGDITGFVASTYKRGMKLVQVPTTLLAQVDSSVGGKTGINLKEGKNLVGTFYQPHAVVVDVCTLNSLPLSEYIAGLAEVIKYAFTMDPELFEFLIEKKNEILLRNPEVVSIIVEKALRNKARIVENDEREEKGRREVLNFGHTVGHAIEICSNHYVLHGQAVAIGMVEEARMAVRKGLLTESVLELLIYVLLLFGLPTELPDDIDFNQLHRVIKQDKKVSDGQLTIPMLTGIGRTTMVVDKVDNLDITKVGGNKI
jgi:3-dehydroquinate synthase